MDHLITVSNPERNMIVAFVNSEMCFKVLNTDEGTLINKLFVFVPDSICFLCDIRLEGRSLFASVRYEGNLNIWNAEDGSFAMEFQKERSEFNYLQFLNTNILNILAIGNHEGLTKFNGCQ